MPERLAKADLGPPRNALLWMRAKEMAANLGRGASFQTILQMYQMLTLAPGFGAVSKAKRPKISLRRPKNGVKKGAAPSLRSLRTHSGSTGAAAHKYIKRERKGEDWAYTYPKDVASQSGPKESNASPLAADGSRQSNSAPSDNASSATIHAPSPGNRDQAIDADVSHVAHPKMSFDDRQALSFYQGPHFEALNNNMRDAAVSEKVFNRNQKVNPLLKNKNALVSLIKKSKVKKDVTAYRGMSLPPESIKAGALISDNAFVSTTTSIDVAREFSASSAKKSRKRIPVVISTVIPAGASALAVTHHANRDEDDDYRDEHELLLEPKTAFKVVSTKIIKGVHYVQAELVSPQDVKQAKKESIKTIVTPPQEFTQKSMGCFDKYVPSLNAAYHINASPDWVGKMQRLTVSPPAILRPTRLVGSLDEVVDGLPLPPEDAMWLRQGLSAILEGGLDAGQVMQHSHDACEDAGIYQPGIKKEVAQRMAYLVGMADPYRKSLSKRLNCGRGRIMKRRLITKSLGAGSRGGRVIGHTRSGKIIYASESGAYSEVHAKPMGQQHAAVRDHFPRYSAEDHKDAAEAHRDSSGPMAGRYKHMMAAAHDEAASKVAIKSTRKFTIAKAGCGKRAAAGDEDGRFAIKHPAASPWDNQKSMKENFDMMKSNEMDGINFGEASLPAPGASAQSVDSVTELQQVIADFEAASVGGTQGVKVIEWALHDDTHPTGVEGADTTPVPVDLSANAPGLPFGQTITLNKGHGEAVAPQPFSPLLSTLQFYATQVR